MIPKCEKLRLFLAAGLIAVAAGCGFVHEAPPPERQPPPAASPAPDSVHLFFGNPSNASTDENVRDNYLIVGAGSAISYNDERGTANWVSWRTVKADLGPSLPRPDFRPDPRLPGNFTRITPFDYSGSGYDRGHLVPSADRFGDEELNEETFLMTNIVPQARDLNQYPWEKLESYARGQARRGLEVHQIAGVYGAGTVLKGKVTAPANCWKIIAILPAGRAVDERTRVIAVDMPNIEGIAGRPWESFKTTVRAIEEKTGYDFFAGLPRGVQDAIETRTEMRSR